ncbi:MAG: UDP-N-acetylmuramoyl-L-alanyl-D-glutamate--2,6-diaminopimelate ligase [Leptolyngbya foveolarum]|uniref:UDP-N-acetylmuramoyl-L-alanyl-D-glutamate--2,6-diaminopimelate ligase n=1 Tax=Leptolyngbya foveolarum TaxID=47253 RepID=A0A2W4UBF6_9CYAN|nr:MAG: UDP-N-acetylmuramoyl-L-alanyl-D-glutamate--2,6-diaminopimelate ligase [Leptolyngbya foveolarum]
MLLKELLSQLTSVQVETTSSELHDSWSKEVTGLCANSQAIAPGNLFIGMPGTRIDGGEFWPSAIEKGAIATLITPESLVTKPNPNNQALVLTTPDVPKACAEIAAAFYNRPAQSMKMVGVTGTNGKTTTTHLIEYFLNQAQQKTAILGTLYTRWPGHEKVAVHTTPFPIDLQAELASARDANCQNAVMEISSHALAQHRAWSIPFEVAVFTNLTQDHLDYHKDLDDYFEAKALLFNPDYLTGRAIFNKDDAYGQKLIARAGDRPLWTYSVEDASADLYTADLTYGPTGVSGTLCTPAGEQAFTSPLVGQFNLENLLAAVGSALHLGVGLDQIVRSLPGFAGVPGRMERVQIKDSQDISVIVDYAHTPDSLDNALQAARPFVSGQLICVFGCGGDRDRTKRPKMGRIAYEQSDRAIVTSDNPRTEDPEQILKDVVAGIEATLDDQQVICDRAQAIRSAILNAQPGDGIIIAGKGHEDYQILGTEKIHFDDREQSRAALKERLTAQ